MGAVGWIGRGGGGRLRGGSEGVGYVDGRWGGREGMWMFGAGIGGCGGDRWGCGEDAEMGDYQRYCCVRDENGGFRYVRLYGHEKVLVDPEIRDELDCKNRVGHAATPVWLGRARSVDGALASVTAGNLGFAAAVRGVASSCLTGSTNRGINHV